VFVNGTSVVREGKHLGTLPGRVLRRGKVPVGGNAAMETVAAGVTSAISSLKPCQRGLMDAAPVKIDRFVENHNTTARPLAWSATADSILARCLDRKRGGHRNTLTLESFCRLI